jgi:signal transduction histidine kinase
LSFDNQSILLVSKDKKFYNILASFYKHVHYYSSINEVVLNLKSINPLCVFCDNDINDEFWGINDGVDFFKKIIKDSKEISKILIQDEDDFNKLERAINQGNIFAIINSSFCEEDIKLLVQDALDYANLLRENSILLSRAKIRNTELLRLKSLLEQKNKTAIENMKGSFLKETYVRKEVECINRLLLLFPKLKSLKEMENVLKEELSPFIPIDFVKISINQINAKQNKAEQKDLCAVSTRLFFSGSTIGFLKFGRNEFPPVFTDDELVFFDRVCEVSSVYVEKLMKLSELNDLKEQWELLFNSINEPLSLINKDLEFIAVNSSFIKTFSANHNFVSDKALLSFQTGEPSSSQILAKNKRTYSVWTYPIHDGSETKKAIQFYKDITEELKYKEGLVYSEKMAELGILAGSVAHELSNPVGGVLAYLQMMMEEADKNSKLFFDLVEMEKAASRCAQIAKNLLSFSRTSKDDDDSIFTFSSVFESVLPIIKIQLRNEKTVLSFSDLSSGLKIKGSFNDISQALLNLLSICVDDLRQNKIEGKELSKSSKLEVLLKDCESFALCKISCNGLSLDKDKFNSLSFFVAERIIERALGRLIIDDFGFSVYLKKSF